MPTRFLALMLLVAAPANAQEIASSFDQLRVLVKPGDTVIVTDGAGTEVKGSIAQLSTASMVLLIGQDRRDFQASDVTVVRQRRPDSLANGAKWGFGVGAGLGLLAVASVASEYGGSDAGFAALAVLLYGGIGAGVGVGIDAMISTEQVIFAAPRRVALSLRF